MEGLDLGQTSNPSLAWKNGRFKNNMMMMMMMNFKNVISRNLNYFSVICVIDR